MSMNKNQFPGSSMAGDTYSLNNHSEKPVLFLDIDGVLNSTPRPKPHMVHKYGEYENAEILGFPIWWSPGVIDFFNALNASGKVDVVWLTTWVNEARVEFAPVVGLDDFPAITDSSGGSFPFSPNWWKWDRVKDFLGFNDDPERSVIWIDDDLNRHIKSLFRERFSTPSLLITPMECPGLVPDNLDRILEFIDE